MDICNTEAGELLKFGGATGALIIQSADGVMSLFETGDETDVWAVVFSSEDRHLFSGNGNGMVQQFNIADGREVAKQMPETQTPVFSISVSRDGKWVAYGTGSGASVWDSALQEKVVNVEGENEMRVVDFSPDSTCLATCTAFPGTASVWVIATGKRIVGPLEFDDIVTSVCFSPDGQRIATSVFRGPISIFDSYTGDKLVTINTRTARSNASTRLAWTTDGQQIFAPCIDKKVKSYEVSTGIQLVESQVMDGYGDLDSMALASNGKFIVTYAGSSVFFFDSATLSQISPVIEEKHKIFSIALSHNSSYLATGQSNGKVALHKLTSILPDSFLKTSIPEEKKHGEQHSTSGGGTNPDSHSDESRDNNADDIDLLEVEIPTSAPAPAFDYDEPPSAPASIHSRVDEVPPCKASNVISQPTLSPLAIAAPKQCPDELADTPGSSKRPPKFGAWFKSKIGKQSQAFESPKHGRKRSSAPIQPPILSESFPPSTMDPQSEHHPTITPNKRARRLVHAPPGEERYNLFMMWLRGRPRERPYARTPIRHEPGQGASRTDQCTTEPNQAAPVRLFSHDDRPP
ncbi:WD40-repeat-containing domain protein [Chiua virens]|nr:WD40-repeat-containing domain protein [Chiua virens]